MKTHITHLKTVLQLLRINELFAKKSKCAFGQNNVEYLGHIINGDGVAADPEKIRCMIEWPAPTNLKSLRGFLGLTGYYRRFVKGYGAISRPLTNLLKNDSFLWGEEASSAFQKLKEVVTSTPVLALPNFNIAFEVETDACDTGVGAVIMQRRRPIAFFSKALGKKFLGMSTYEKELLAIVMAVNKWRSYLMGNHFIIHTDHQSIKHFLEQKIHTFVQQKWLSKLLGYDYEIQYKKGKENLVVDALSRVAIEGRCAAMSSIDPAWMKEVTNSYEDDTIISDMQSKIIIDKDALPHYTYSQGILRYKGKIVIGKAGNLRDKIMHDVHESAMGGHSGTQASYQRARSMFYWVGMKREIFNFVLQCDICQRNKGEHSYPAGLLQPLPVPKQAWQDISMDFVEGLPKSEGKDCIFVVVDRFTKFSHFIPLAHPFTASTVARAFIDNVYKLHGMPRTIVSDRGSIFLSAVWQELFTSMGTKLHMSTSYHPETDGQTERTNACLESYLRCMTSYRPYKWATWLALGEWWFNTSFHTSLKMSPFQALYGFEPPQLGIHSEFNPKVATVEEYMQQRRVMIEVLKESLNKSQNRMKQFADKKRTERKFEVGDQVYLKLQPYRQTSIELRHNMKLSSKFYGPFTVIEKIGEVAYKLQLPVNSKIRPVFHVSQLKKKVGTRHSANPQLPLVDPNGNMVVAPAKILDRRLVKKNNKAVTQVLIRWSHSVEEDATWEDYDTMKRNFPSFDT